MRSLSPIFISVCLACAMPQAQAVQQASAASAADGMSLVSERLAKAFAESSGGASEVALDKLLQSLDKQGHWPDLDIKYDPVKDAGVSRYVHFLRVWKLAGAWHLSNEPARRAQLLEAFHRSLNFWLFKPKPASIPWFYLIGAPQAVARAALIMDGQLTSAQREAAIRILRTCVDANGTLIYAGSPATGQNLQHEAELQIVAGILAGDAAGVRKHAALIEHEIAIRDAEGLKADWSFHQHGPQLYSGGLYGNGFARDSAKLAWALQGTPFAFKPATIDALVHYVADGQQWMLRAGSFDYLTAGRMVAWPGFMGVEPEGEYGVGDAAKNLAGIAGLAPARRAALLAMAARIGGKASASGAPGGNRVFWASDYVSHQRAGFFASARMSSRRTVGHESGNGQNEQGYHLGDGATSLMVTGEEYRDIFPLLDWRRLPGVTAVYNPAVAFPRHTWGKGARGWSDFAGGVSDGRYGAAAMELRRAGLQAYKSWFFLDDVVVNLGAGILPDDPALPVVTGIEQRWGKGEMVSSAGLLEPERTHSQAGTGWVHHDGVTYLFAGAADVRIRLEHKSAPWSVLNSATHGSMFRTTTLKEVIASGNVFSLWLEHGTNIHVPAKYEYMIAPGLAPAAIETFRKQSAPVVVANTDKVQALARGSLVQAVFWQAGALRLPDGRTLSLDRPGMVQLRRDDDGATIVAAGNPTHQPGAMLVRVSGAAGKPLAVNFRFPAGLYAGRPQVKSIGRALPR